ncbi:hypothetical protein ACLEQD_41035, partial [Corallococcus sp. 4LFB]
PGGGVGRPGSGGPGKPGSGTGSTDGVSGRPGHGRGGAGGTGRPGSGGSSGGTGALDPNLAGYVDALQVLDQNWDTFDAAVGAKDGKLTMANLEAVLANPAASPTLKRAAQFFKDHPEYFRRLEMAESGGARTASPAGRTWTRSSTRWRSRRAAAGARVARGRATSWTTRT